MDRRSFLQKAGLTAASFAGSSDVYATAPGPPRASNKSADLTPWVPSASNQTWDVHTINHLYRRAGFGATLAEIKAAAALTPSDAIDALMVDSLLTQTPPNPRHSTPPDSQAWLGVAPYVGVDTTLQNAQLALYYNAQMEIRRHWTVQMAQPATMLRERMMLFWMNHFVIEARKVQFPHMIYNYMEYMRFNAWGNFKQMVKDVTIAPSMLFYLDGGSNRKGAPNENYARELQELFTMGVYYKNDVTKPNYTQDDIEAIAKALTGWVVNYQSAPPDVLSTSYNVNFHDSTYQTVYDSTPRRYNLKAAENYGVQPGDYDMDLIEHIFTVKADAIAWYICSKLYQNFVYHDISGSAALSVIDAMASIFKTNWEIKPVLAALLKSAHFFDEGNIGAEIKSPYDYLINITRTFGIPVPVNDPSGIGELTMGTLYTYAYAGGQELLNPPNVKGWPGYRSWMSVTTLPYLNLEAVAIANGSLPVLGTTTDGYGASLLPLNFTNDMVTAWGKQFTNYTGPSFDDMLKEMATYLCAHTPSDNALASIKGKFPPNVYEWSALDDSSKINPLRLMAAAIMQLADYQLS